MSAVVRELILTLANTFSCTWTTHIRHRYIVRYLKQPATFTQLVTIGFSSVFAPTSFNRLRLDMMYAKIIEISDYKFIFLQSFSVLNIVMITNLYPPSVFLRQSIPAESTGIPHRPAEYSLRFRTEVTSTHRPSLAETRSLSSRQ